MCKEPHTFKRLFMETVPRQVHQDGHWMTMGLGIKWLNTIKGEPKTLTGKMSPQELCKLASGGRRGTWSFCQLQSFLRSAQKVRDLICQRKGEFEDIARADHVLYKRHKDLQRSHGKNGHSRTPKRPPSSLVLSILCQPQNTLAYPVWMPEHSLLTMGEHPGLPSVHI